MWAVRRAQQHHAFPWPAAAFFIVAVIGLGSLVCALPIICATGRSGSFNPAGIGGQPEGNGVVLIFFGLFFCAAVRTA